MQKILFLFIIFIPVISIAQQQETTTKTSDSLVFAKVEKESEYPGGMAGWGTYLQNNMRYPPKAVKKNIQGTVIVQFIVDATGNLRDIEAIEGPQMLAEEAVRLIKASGKWIPAEQDGKKVKSYKKQPFVFKLER